MAIDNNGQITPAHSRLMGIDIIRMGFACLIPLLHVPFEDGVFISILQQYLARLGVPFFFVASGMFLSISRDKRGDKEAWLRYTKRIGMLLLIWLAIYSPLLIKHGEFSAQLLLFKTPAYLWYLTALLAAAIPFCFVSNRLALYMPQPYFT